MIKVSIRLVDGGYDEFPEDDEFWQELLDLQSQGYRGKQLINTLLSDDWGAPPTSVQIKGKLSNGTLVELQIPYT